MMYILYFHCVGVNLAWSMTSRILSTHVKLAASISITSIIFQFAYDRQFSHLWQGFHSDVIFVQLMACENILARVVFPTP